MSFTIECKDASTKARTGFLKTSHGNLETPFFMPVATKGSVKYITNDELEDIGYRCFISNGFILSLRPGLEIIEKAGSMHEFMNWQHSCFTDSGGFQLLKEELHVKTDDEGIHFRNPFDESRCFLTPEKSIEIQNRLKSDVAMCLDDVPKANLGRQVYEKAVERTFRWAERCKKAHKNSKQLLFGICQGGTFNDLREKSIKGLLKIGFDGLAIGGLSIGEEKEKMHSTVAFCKSIIPETMPVYLMGLGSAREIVEAIGNGIDIFDSNFPTRTARHGLAITSEGNLNIASLKFKEDFLPLEKECRCYVCRKHTRAYIHHLFKTREENGFKYLSYHNLYFIHNLIEQSRKSIKKGRFADFKENFISKFDGR